MTFLILTLAMGFAVAIVGGVITRRRTVLPPSPFEGRIARAVPSTSRIVADSAYDRRSYDWTVEYNSPIGAQRVVLNQNNASYGESVACETARTTAMLHRGTTIEVWTEHRTTGERKRVDAIRVESRKAA